MSTRFYDEIIAEKIKNWVKDPNIRILKPDESKRLFQMRADLGNDEPIKLPLIAISRDTDIKIPIHTKRNLSYDGLRIDYKDNKSALLNAIPIEMNYQLDIYTRKYEEADEYMRDFVFNIVNHPRMIVEIPYNGYNRKMVSYIQLSDSVVDNSDIPEKLFPDQFTRLTLQFRVDDAYLFSIPLKIDYTIGSDIDVIVMSKVDAGYNEKIEPVT